MRFDSLFFKNYGNFTEILFFKNEVIMSFETQNPLLPKGERIHPAIVLVILLLSILFFLLIGSGLMLLLLGANGVGLDEIATLLTDASTIRERNLFRTTIMIQHLAMFVIPSLVVGYFVYQKAWLSKLSLKNFPEVNTWGLGILIMLAAFPLVAASSWLNMQIDLPEWARMLEDDTQEQIKQMLKTEAPYELLFNLFIVAVIPAVGEELVFRGFLQKRLGELLDNPHIAVWLAAFIFSAIHFQFEGFLPRFLLGALLGYLLVWTKNLWVPIIAHFFFNGSQILAQYFSPEEANMELENMNELDLPIWASVIAVGLSVVIVFALGKKLQELHTDSTNMV